MNQIIKVYPFTYEELKALSRALERQYLSYDDEELHAVVNRIFTFIKEHEHGLQHRTRESQTGE